MTSTEHTEAPQFPLTRGCPYAPPEKATEFREVGAPHRVQIWNGDQPWLITRHDQIREVLSNTDRFGADVTMTGFPNTSDAQPHVEGDIFFRKDGQEHLPTRRVLNPDFSVKRSEALRPRMVELADQLIDQLEKREGPVDLIEHFALALPTVVICEVLGVPPEDSPAVHEGSKKVVQLSTPVEEKLAGQKAIHDILQKHAEHKRVEPDDGLLSRLVNTHVDEKGDFDLEYAIRLGMLVIGAGHETTANMIGLGILALIREPEQRKILLSDPDKHASTCTEEMMRYWSMVQTEPRRVCLQDTEVGGVLIRAGEGIICNLPAANRDPEVFENPEALDITRAQRQHIGFGFGIHQCLGQNLSRVEMQVAWPRLFERLPDLRLAVDESELHFHDDALTYGLEELPAEKWRQGSEVNLTGMWQTCKHVLPHMRERGTGAVINISSMAGLLHAGDNIAYSTSKAAVHSMTRSLAIEYAPHGVRINCIVPGMMDTPMGVDAVARNTGTDREEVAAKRAAMVPMGHQGTSDDIAKVALFYASDDSAFITGTVLPVDGGFTLRAGMP